uniref:Nuclear FMR1 interacting protein 2 n=1 Tax=Oryzias latipes TaxID=8090 RepID=A0A3P9MPL9_ORYLA
MLHSSSSNGNRHLSNTHVKQKGTQRHHAPAMKVSNKGLDYKKTMDLKNEKEKTPDLSPHEAQPSEKKDSALLQNGVVNCGLITNGYSSKDNDGSGSEGGYTTPKKRRTRCNNVKNFADVTKEKDKDAQPTNSMQEQRALNLDPAEKGLSSRTDGFKSTHKAETQSTASGECQRKNSDGKAAATFNKKMEEKQKGKNSSPSKEDSWTLFKPLPAFPVDNSSAKIVPKISYASKVKENLKVAQGEEAAPPPPPVRIPVDGETYELQKDIFQNQWGLSFINEPNLGLDGGNGLIAAEDQTPVTSQSEARAVTTTTTHPCLNAMPSLVESCTLSQDSQKRTCAPCQASNPCSPACMVSEEETNLFSCVSAADPKRVVIYDETKDGPGQ